MQILALVFCVIALLLALGLGVPSCIHLVSNGKDRIYTQYHSGHFEGTFLVTPF